MKLQGNKSSMTSSFSSLGKRIGQLLRKPNTLTLVYVCAAILISVQLLITSQTHPKAGWPTLYNNYVIFKMSFVHLQHGIDLYQPDPVEYYDLFKYSPAFAVLMAPFSLLPDMLGLTLWNLLNALALLFSIRMLSGISIRKQNLMLLFLLPELVINLQNAQSNALVAGFMIGALALLEQKKTAAATLLFSLGAVIKIFPATGFLLLLLFPDFKKSVGWSALWMLFFFLLPLPFTGLNHFPEIYSSWFNLLQQDHSASTGLSVFAWLEAWFGLNPEKNIMLFIGLCLLLLPYLRPIFSPKVHIRHHTYLAVLMIWTVIFNHKAESPTFIIAMAGVGLWYFQQESNPWRLALLIFALVMVSISPTDLVPAAWKNSWIKEGVWKAFPCIIIWIFASFELLFRKESKSNIPLH
jgi:hypothetical protein